MFYQIKQSLVNVRGLIRSMGKQNVAKMVENQEYPARMVFTVSLDESGMLSDGAEAKIEVHGVQRNDRTNNFFKIDLPTSQGKKPNQTLQLQMTGIISYFPTKSFASNMILCTKQTFELHYN